MRALGGVKLSNGEASVIRCENVNKASMIMFNEKEMNWQGFIDYWGKKQPGSWKFDDLDKKNDSTSVELFKRR